MAIAVQPMGEQLALGLTSGRAVALKEFVVSLGIVVWAVRWNMEAVKASLSRTLTPPAARGGLCISEDVQIIVHNM